jgi:putative glutamine amidotransferase
VSRIVLTLERGTEGADYRRALADAGFADDEVQALGPEDSPPDCFEGLLLSGGVDVDPVLYGADRHPKLGRVDRRRDELELALIERARASGRPVFGICRGLQLLNVAYGGTLVQDLPSQRPSPVSHHVRSPPDATAHAVDFESGSFLDTGGPSRVAVNSRHHQAIDRLGPVLLVAARAPDGVIEAIEEPGRPVFAVEWHPENFRDDALSRRLFRRFRDAVRLR